MDTTLITPLVTFALGVVSGICGLLAAVYAGKVELKKRKPEAVTHNCRIAKLDVFTFITGDKRLTPPVCPYLDGSDSITCLFDQETNSEAMKMKQAGKGKCYIARFMLKYELE